MYSSSRGKSSEDTVGELFLHVRVAHSIVVRFTKLGFFA